MDCITNKYRVPENNLKYNDTNQLFMALAIQISYFIVLRLVQVIKQ